MRRDDIFVIRNLESANSIGLNASSEGFWAKYAPFSVSDLLPHSPSILLLLLHSFSSSIQFFSLFLFFYSNSLFSLLLKIQRFLPVSI